MKRHALQVAVMFGLVALVGLHVVGLHRVASIRSWPLVVTLPIVAVAVLKHAGLFAVLRARLRHRS